MCLWYDTGHMIRWTCWQARSLCRLWDYRLHTVASTSQLNLNMYPTVSLPRWSSYSSSLLPHIQKEQPGYTIRRMGIDDLSHEINAASSELNCCIATVVYRLQCGLYSGSGCGLVCPLVDKKKVYSKIPIPNHKYCWLFVSTRWSSSVA